MLISIFVSLSFRLFVALESYQSLIPKISEIHKCVTAYPYRSVPDKSQGPLNHPPPMASTFNAEHPQVLYTPEWHGDARTPVVDGKYHDPATGELRVASGDHGYYLGPPAVDIIIRSQHEDTCQCVYRAARPFPVEALLFQIMRVVHDRKLEVDSLNATPYAIRIILSHELTVEEFKEYSLEMANGIWDQES